MRCLTPAYEGAARGGEPFVAGTVAELTAIWKALVKVYGSREKAAAACAKNSQVYLPYINTPECIVGAHGALVELFGAEGAAGGGAGWAESVLVPCWRVAVSIEQVHALCVCLPTAAAEGEEEEHAAVAVVVGCGVEAFPIWCKAGSVERMVAE